MNPVKLKIIGWLVAAVVTALLVALAGQTYRLTAEQRDHSKTRQEYAEKISTLERQGREAVEAARAEEKRRQADLEAIVNETEQKLDAALADRNDARDAGQRLRDQIAALTGSCRRTGSNTVPAQAGQAADPTGDLLADVQRRLDEAANGIAEYADRAHTAGSACERSYDSLTAKK